MLNSSPSPCSFWNVPHLLLNLTRNLFLCEPSDVSIYIMAPLGLGGMNQVKISVGHCIKATSPSLAAHCVHSETIVSPSLNHLLTYLVLNTHVILQHLGWRRVLDVQHYCHYSRSDWLVVIVPTIPKWPYWA